MTVADTPDRVASSGVSYLYAYACGRPCNSMWVGAWLFTVNNESCAESTGVEGCDQITFETDRVAAWW